MDRLSELHDRVIRRILCLVPTIYAVQMSLLSKRWRYMWYSLPVSEFSDHDFAGAILQHKLGRFMDKCLKLRENDMLSVTDNAVTKFKLLPYYSWGSNVVGWFRLVAKSNIKELDLYIIRSGEGKLWHLPVDLLRVRALSHLRLNGIQLKDLHSTSLPLLISLSLVRVHLDDQALHNILLGCCSLEKLLLDSCHGLLNIEVSSISLKFLKIDCCTGLLKLAISSSSIEFLEMDSSACATFQIKAVNLESLRLSDIVLKDIHSVSLPSLVSLSLVRVRLDDQAIHNLLSGCCSLEKLFLNSCHGLYKPEVSSLSLKFLEIDSCQSPRFEIKAIKLESLLCHGVRACFKLNLSSCKTLKNLSLTSSISSEQGLEYAN
ncbi:F-box domain containing protein [Parasponia andersonii]|uniref:F-box domain containing protein n=1 Tax=Parasponia andersonii TaxID=3476 RepID=A0A2P5A6F3_PARAD|nr:F-box domain containing protein [Parasponia andersonii]